MSAPSEMNPPVLVAGINGSEVTLNWTHDDLGDAGWQELHILSTGEIHQTQTNGVTIHVSDGEWRFEVMVFSEDGRSATSNEVVVVVDTKPPEIPEVRLHYEDIVVTLEWATVPRAVSYEIICNSDWIGNVAGAPDTLTTVQFVHHAWHDGVYDYQVRARDAEGRWSAFSSTVTHIVDTSPPAAPEVIVLAKQLLVRVQWQQPPGKQPVLYHVRCNGEDVGTTTEKWFNTIVDKAGPYSYRVQGVDSEDRVSAWSEVTPISSVYIGHKEH